MPKSFAATIDTTCQASILIIGENTPNSIFRWNLISGSGTIGSLSTYNTIITNLSPGTNVFTRTATSASTGLFQIDTFKVERVPAPQLPALAPIIICPGQSATVAMPFYPGGAYTWSNGSTGHIISTSTPGVYTVSLSYYGCNVSTSVEVISLPVVNTPIHSGVLDSVCYGQPITITVGSDSLGIYRFSWYLRQIDGNDLPLSTSGTTPSFTTNPIYEPLVFAVTARNSQGCESAKLLIPVTVKARPLAINTQPTAISTAQLQLHLPFKGTLTDASGNNRNATGYNNYGSDRNGCPGTAFRSIIPAQQQVSVPANPGFDFQGGDFTFSFWFNTESNAQQTIFLLGNPGAEGYRIFINHQRRLCFQTGGVIRVLPYAQTNVDKWHCAIIRRKGNTLNLLLDGVYVNYFIGNNVGAQEPLLIASNQGSFRGLLSDIRIFKRAISPSEIQWLSNEFNVPTTTALPSAVCLSTFAQIVLHNPQPRVRYQVFANYTGVGGAIPIGPALSGNCGALNFSLPNLSNSGTYNIAATHLESGCTRSISIGSIQVLPKPATPDVINLTNCGTATIDLLNLIVNKTPGLTYRFFTSATGNIEIPYTGSNIFYTTTNLWVQAQQQAAANCINSVRSKIQITIQPKPSMPQGQHVYSCSPASVTLNVTGATPSQRYKWYTQPTGGNQLPHYGPSQNVYLNGQDVKLYVSIINLQTSCESDRLPITAFYIGPNRSPQLSINNAPVCAGQQIPITVTNHEPGLTYRWSTNPALPLGHISYTADPKVVLITVPNGSVTVTAELIIPIEPCPTTTSSITISSQASPTLQLPTMVDACPNETITMGEAAEPGYAYLWAGLGITNPTLSLQDITAFNANSFVQTLIYTLTKTNLATGCSLTRQVALKVSPAINLSVGNVTNVCSNDTLRIPFYAASNVSVNLLWNNPPPTVQFNAWVDGSDIVVTGSNPSSRSFNPNLRLLGNNASTGCLREVAVGPLGIHPNFNDAAGPNLIICSNNPVQLGTVVQALPGTQFTWTPSFGLNDPTISQPTFYWPNNSGGDTLIEFKLYTLTAEGCNDTSYTTLTLLPALPELEVKDTTICVSGSITIGELYPPGNLNYTWQSSPHLLTGIEPSQAVVTAGPFPIDTTLYFIRTAFNDDCSFNDTVAVKVEAIPSDTIEGNTFVCPGMGDSYYFVYPFRDGYTYTYTAIGGVIISSDEIAGAQIFWPDTATVARIVVTITSARGCMYTVSKDITISNRLQPRIGTNDPVEFCANSIAPRTYFVRFPTAGNNYNWTVNGGTIVNANNDSTIVNVVWQGAGQHEIFVGESNPATAGIACQGNSASIMVNVKALPQLTSAVTGPAEVCIGVANTFTISASNYDLLEWEVESNNYQISALDDSLITLTFYSVGTVPISVKAYGFNGCLSQSEYLVVQVNDLPSISNVPNINQAICAAAPFGTYTAQGTYANGYTWQAIGGKILSSPNADTVIVEWLADAPTHRLRVAGVGANCSGNAFEAIPNVDFSIPSIKAISYHPEDEKLLMVYLNTLAQTNGQQRTELFYLHKDTLVNQAAIASNGSTLRTITFPRLSDKNLHSAYVRYRNLCGNQTSQRTHSPVILTGRRQGNAMEMTWIPYVGWNDHPLNYEFEVRADGNPGWQSTYTFEQKGLSAKVVPSPVSGTQCYRIKVKGPDGTISYSNTICDYFETFLVPANVITLNNDGKNDAWLISNLERYPNTAVEIANRWGQTVFSSTDYKNNWQPTELPTGTYFYVIKNPILRQPIRGWVELMR